MKSPSPAPLNEMNEQQQQHQCGNSNQVASLECVCVFQDRKGAGLLSFYKKKMNLIRIFSFKVPNHVRNGRISSEKKNGRLELFRPEFRPELRNGTPDSAESAVLDMQMRGF